MPYVVKRYSVVMFLNKVVTLEITKYTTKFLETFKFILKLSIIFSFLFVTMRKQIRYVVGIYQETFILVITFTNFPCAYILSACGLGC